MKKYFKIIEELHENTDGKKELSVEDYLESIENKRDKIRSLSTIIVTVCGMLLSSNFIILFFLIKETKQAVNKTGSYLAFFISVVLLVSLLYAIKSVYLESPVGVSTKGEQMQSQNAIYKKECHNLKLSFRYLLISIGVFIANMGIMIFTH